jgi:hypothetical protein
VFTGTVVAMSPSAQNDYLLEQKTLQEINPEAAKTYKVLEVGDVVHLTHFMFMDKRFYLSKQDRDFIKNPNEFRIEHWEGYVIIHPTQIEAIELNADDAQLINSPYISYTEWEKMNNGDKED